MGERGKRGAEKTEQEDKRGSSRRNRESLRGKVGEEVKGGEEEKKKKEKKKALPVSHCPLLSSSNGLRSPPPARMKQYRKPVSGDMMTSVAKYISNVKVIERFDSELLSAHLLHAFTYGNVEKQKTEKQRQRIGEMER